MTVDLVTLPEQEIAAAGVHTLKSGQTVITPEELQAAIDAANNDPAVLAPRVKLAHEKEYDTGEPAFGIYENLRLEGDKLYGTPTGVPRWLADVWPSAFPNRSIEGPKGWTSPSGRTHKLVIEAVGLLGVKMPGIKGLADVKHWYGSKIPESVVLAAYGDAVNVEPTKEKIVPYPKAMLDKLGLPEDAADDVVLKALDDLEAKAKGDPKALEAEVEKRLAAEKERLTTEAQADAQKKIDETREAATKDALEKLKEQGLTVVEASALEELKTNAKAGADLAAETAKAKRIELVEAAVGDGRIAPAKKDDFVKALESGAIDAETLAALPSVVPVEARGGAGSVEASAGGSAAAPERVRSNYTDAEWARLVDAGLVAK